MSFGHSELMFNDDGFIKVSGINENPNDMATSNGSGKSSLWESIIWALTGETIRGTKHISNIYGDDGTYVQLFFTIDTHSYSILRSKEHKQYKTSLIIEIDGKDCSGKGIRDSEKLLAQYLPDITASLLGSVIILGQGLPQRFTNNTPSGRKEVLETLSKSDFMIDDLRARIDSRKQELASMLRSFEDETLKLTAKADLLNQTLMSNTSTLDTLIKGAFEEEKDSLEKDKEVLTTLLVQEGSLVQENEIKIENLTAQLLEINTHITEEKAKIDLDYHTAVDPIRDMLNRSSFGLQNAQSEIKRIENIKDVCPTCGQALPNVIKPDTSSLQNQCRIYLDEIASFKREIAEKDKMHSHFILEVQQKYDSLKTSLSQSLENAKKLKREHNLKYIEYNEQISTLTNRIAQITAKLMQIDATRSTLINDNERIAKELDTINEQLLYNTSQKELYQTHLDVVNKFDTAIKRDFRGYLLQNVIEYIEKRAKEYSFRIFDTDMIEFCLEGNNINISYMGKEYENLSGGEKQKIDLIIQFSIRDMLCNHLGFTSNIIVLDEVFDGLDMIGCQRVVDLIASLSDIKNVFIVTHRKDLSIPCDKELIVVKSPEGISDIR